MGNNGVETPDDQGTGWFQVKKKHRSSSKFSLQSWVGGISGRNASNPLRGQSSLNDGSGNSRDKRQHQQQKGIEDCAVHGQSNFVTNSINASSENRDNESVVNKVVSPKNDSGAMRKEKSVGVGIKFGAIEDDNLIACLDGGTRSQVKIFEEVTPSNPMLESNPEGPEIDDNHKDSNGVSISNDNIEEDHSSPPQTEQVKEVNDESLAANISFRVEVDVDSSEGQPLSTLMSRDHVVLHYDTPSSSHNTSTIGESDTVESKERFRQRLWCFLFENLNRAVDELYLLCELECDVEQMNEAILVLGEAASDFKELNSRVEEFESIKKSSPHFSNGVPINLKSDNRRPHALSWEVRRMTTSAHKAEILQSSLEAFKKIQRDRDTLHHTNNTRVLQNLESCDSLKQSYTSDKMDCSKNVIEESHAEQNGVPNSAKLDSVGDGHGSSSSVIQSELPPMNNSATGKSKKEHCGLESAQLPKKVKGSLTEAVFEKNQKLTDHHSKRQISASEQQRVKEKRTSDSWKSMDAWKQKRNWRDILSSPFRASSRVSHSPGMSRKSAERARILHDKLMSPEKKKKTAVDLRKDAAEKHARATRIRSELENERAQKLQRTTEKLSRVTEWQADRSMKLRQGMYARQRRSESRHEAFLAQVVKRAGDESSKVNEVRFITSLNEENKKFSLRRKLQDSESRRAEKLQVMKSKQKEDMAREEAVLERRKLIEAEKLQRLAETQKRKEEAQIRREEERKASSAAREMRALEQLRRKEERAKLQQEESELLAQKLAEKLSESEQRRKFYLEQIRERASMDFSRDQSSPLLRRSLNKEGQSKPTQNNATDDKQSGGSSGIGRSTLMENSVTLQHSMKRRIKRIRQRLMALKYEFLEPMVGGENAGIGYRTALGTARVRIGRWLQELQRLRQARKEGAASIGLIAAEIIKYLEGKDAELHASRQAGLIDFIASTLPASHTSKPEACQVTIYLLKLLKVVLSLPANRSYFLAQNLLPPIIPMLSASLENYIKIAASLNLPGNTNLPSIRTSAENFESISEVLDGFLWTVTTIIGHSNTEEQQIQMRDSLLELLTAYQVIHRLRDLFALYDRPQVEGSPFPSSILLSINLLVVLTSRQESNYSIDWESLHVETSTEIGSSVVKFTEYADTGFPTDTTGVLKSSLISSSSCLKVVPEDMPLDSTWVVRVNQDVSEESEVRQDTVKSLSPQKDEKKSMECMEQKSENAVNMDQPVVFLLSAMSETGLVSLLSLLTAVLLQANNRLSSDQGSYVLPCNFEEVATGVLKVLNNLALLDIKCLQRMLSKTDLKMEFFHLLSFLLSHCNSKWKTANDQVGMLLLESLSLLGHFALFHPGNQAVLRWGKTPTILHKICDLPFVFFSDPELMPSLASTLVAACFECEQNKGIVQQEISTDMLLSLLRSCRNSPVECSDNNNINPLNPELKKAQLSGRHSSRNARGKKSGKVRNGRATRMSNEETGLRPSSEISSSSMMLHCRLSIGFVDKAEHFFSSDVAEQVYGQS